MQYDPQLPHGARVVTLTPATESQQVLTPETEVHVINRGFDVIERKFNALDYPLHPHTVGYLKMPYGAALHFQKHCTVPGTRDAFSGSEQSFLGIVGIDSPEMCEPFTREQCAKFGLRHEALIREDGDEVQAVAVNAAVASGKVPVGRGAGTRGKGVAFAKQGVTAKGDSVDTAEMLSAPDETAAERVARLNAEAEA